MNRWRRSRRNMFVQTIAPGKSFETEIEGKVVGASEEATFTPGAYAAIFDLEMNDQALANLDPAPTKPLWTGKLCSGEFSLSVDRSGYESCLDCHATEDYHHKETRDCKTCHVDKDDFNVNTASCSISTIPRT